MKMLLSARNSGRPSPALQTHRQHARDINRVTPGAVVNLMPARGAVGDDDGVVGRLAYGGQQRQLAHGARHLDRIGVVAEGAGHAAAARLDFLDLKAGNEFQRRLDRRHRIEGFLMAMAVQEGALLDRREMESELSGRGFACQKFFEQQRVARQRCRAVSLLSSAGISSRKLNRQLGSRPITGTPRSTIRRERVERALRFAPRLLDLADREKGASAAERARAVGRRREMDPIAGRVQYRHRRVNIFALEVAIERVGEQNDFAACYRRRHSRQPRFVEKIRAPLRQAAPRAEAGDRFR